MKTRADQALKEWEELQSSSSTAISSVNDGDDDDNDNNKSTTTSLCGEPNMSSEGVSCLGSNVTFAYPNDAREHMLEIHHAMKNWTSQFDYHCAPATRKGRYCGPWIENYWMDHFSDKVNDKVNNNNNTCLSDTFGPYIPLLIPWVDIWYQGRFRPKFPPKFIKLLKSLLRPDVLYITVSQNDEGLARHHGFPQLDNLLVLSAGGEGHVPIPMLKQEESLVVKKKDHRSWLVSYAGSLGHAPERMRERMHEFFTSAAVAPSTTNYTHYYGRNQAKWRDIMSDSYISLAPRGSGRTAYHLMEILQRGYIPVHVYHDYPWVPYRKLYQDKLGYMSSVEELPALLEQFQSMSEEDFQQREAQIALHRESHLSPDGIMHQIELFMHGGGDLECGLPTTLLLDAQHSSSIGAAAS